jgi:hypothetical protein
MELNLEIGTPEARWAVGLARELMNARVIAGQEMTGPGPLPAVFVDALNRAVQEVLGDDESSWEESSLRRCAYLIAAQASVGHAAVVTAGTTMEEGGLAPAGEGTQQALELLARSLEQLGGSL